MMLLSDRRALERARKNGSFFKRPPERPNHPDKGEKDGHCNRTACQAPLKGEPQWFMRSPFTDGSRLHYCEVCARDFNDWDRRSGDPIRCEQVEDDPT